MSDNQTNIFEMLYPTFKITKPIRLITLFSGYDSQALALKYLGVDFEHYKTCEWAIKSIQALKDLHFGEDNIDYSKKLTTDEIKEYLYNKGVSNNYNDPMSKEQVSRLNEKQVRIIYNNIKATHNLVNIQQVKGENLEIKDTDKFTYLLTYSFPCQDLSLAGKGKGMSDTTTRSGMLWEVERILTECKEKPQILLMENVPQVHGEGNKEDFNKWQLRLEELGYSNYWQDLIATDYGIPQTRNRCFMVSILGNYNYTFPKPIPLKLKLKDMLEDKIDEKYYLSDKMIKYLTDSVSSGGIDRSESFTRIQEKIEKDGIAATITTNAGNRATDNFIKIKGSSYIRNYGSKGKLQTITTSGGEHLGVCVKGIATNESKEWQKEPLEEKSRTILANKSNGGVGCIDNNLRIRKLIPKECFRLMGVKDEDYDKIAKNQSDSSLYHLAGDSIVVNVLMAIFKELL